MKARGLPSHHVASEILSRRVGWERFSPPASGSTAQVVQRPLPPHHFQRRAFASRAAAHSRYPYQTSISSPLIAHRPRLGGGGGLGGRGGGLRRARVDSSRGGWPRPSAGGGSRNRLRERERSCRSPAFASFSPVYDPSRGDDGGLGDPIREGHARVAGRRRGRRDRERDRVRTGFPCGGELEGGRRGDGRDPAV